MTERGGINLPIVLAAAFGLGLAASVYLNITQHQTAQNDKKLLQGEISDLRYQVRQDLAAKTASANASPSPTPLATPEASSPPSPAPSPSSAVLDASVAKAIQSCSPDAALRADVSASSLQKARVPKGAVVTVGEIRNKYRAVTYNSQSGYILTACLR